VSATAAAALVDELWRRAVEDPAGIDDPALAEWLAETSGVLGETTDKQPAAVLRKAVRLARKLAKYWGEHDPSSLPDWRNGVDEALGTAGWEPQLDLVLWGLDDAPDPVTFEEAKTRFRAARFTPWMEDVSYEEWLEQR
jgi:hypothetical protein